MATRPPPRELFFGPLAVVLKPNDIERIHFAYVASKYGHAGQTREGGGRYFDHPKAAAWIYIDELGGRDPRTIINTLLHDLSEDAYLLSPYRLGLNFGEEIAQDVRALTKLPKGKETTDDYLRRIIARGPETITAKLCDRLHNLRTLEGCTPDKRVRTIKETQDYHLRMLIPALGRFGKPWNSHASTLANAIDQAMMVSS